MTVESPNVRFMCLGVRSIYPILILEATRMALGEELKEFSLPLNVSTSISLRVRYQLFMLDPETGEVSMVIKLQGLHI